GPGFAGGNLARQGDGPEHLAGAVLLVGGPVVAPLVEAAERHGGGHAGAERSPPARTGRVVAAGRIYIHRPAVLGGDEACPGRREVLAPQLKDAGPQGDRLRESSAPGVAVAPPPGTISARAIESTGRRLHGTQPPKGSFSGTPSRRTSERLAPLGPRPRSETPWEVGLAVMLSFLRNRLKSAAPRSAASTVRE